MRHFTVTNFQFRDTQNIHSLTTNLHGRHIKAESVIMAALKIARMSAINIRRKLDIVVTFVENISGIQYVGYVKKDKNKKGEYFYYGQVQET